MLFETRFTFLNGEAEMSEPVLTEIKIGTFLK